MKTLKNFKILKATFDKLDNELREVNSSSETLKKNFMELTELKHILQKTQIFFDEVNKIIFEFKIFLIFLNFLNLKFFFKILINL